jgi:Viral BACON domain
MHNPDRSCILAFAFLQGIWFQGVIMKSALLSAFLLPIVILLLVFSGCSESDDSNPTSPDEDDPILQVSVNTLAFGEEETTLQFIVTNGGGQELEWTITTNSDWIEVFPAAGVTREENDAVSVTINRTDMVHGEYAGTVTLMTTDGQNWTINASMIVPAPDPVLLWSLENKTLDEDYYTSSPEIEIPYDGLLAMNMQLNDWPGHYGLELLVMSPAEYNHYRNDDSFSVYWHETISSEGTHIRLAPGLIAAGTMVRIVVDNTNWGWEDTDFDFFSDDALFDLEVAIGPID